MIGKSLRTLLPKCDYGKISVKHAFSLVALSRMSGIHKRYIELSDTKIWISKNATLCRVLANRVTNYHG